MFTATVGQATVRAYAWAVALHTWAKPPFGRMPGRLLCTRPRKSAQDAIQKVDELLHRGYTNIVDADLSKYFDTIPHSELLQCVARRIVDGPMLHLIKMWIKAPVEERDENGKRQLTGGKDNDRGTPQGGVVSPALANLYTLACVPHEPDVEGLAADQARGTVSGAHRELRG